MVSSSDVRQFAARLRREGIVGPDFLRDLKSFCCEGGTPPEELEVILEVYSLQDRIRRSIERREAALDDLYARELDWGAGLSSVLKWDERGFLPVGGFALA